MQFNHIHSVHFGELLNVGRYRWPAPMHLFLEPSVLWMVGSAARMCVSVRRFIQGTLLSYCTVRCNGTAGNATELHAPRQGTWQMEAKVSPLYAHRHCRVARLTVLCRLGVWV